MSLAGVDPTAVTGTPGSVEQARQLETVAEIRETGVSRREDIAHTNISMGLDVIFKQFIYISTHSWLTTDMPGKVIAIFPVHPDACNSYTSRVYSMFNSWVGGQRFRIRIIGTAFYGGGLYFVRIPPEFKLDEIHQMTLSGLSAFPHADLDPKNLSSIDIDMQDYRSTHFHTGELDLNDPTSFGGYLAVVVNARLVTQSPDVHSIDFRVEAAGAFDFKVPRPIREAPSESSGPLSNQSLSVPSLRGCDDMMTSAESCFLVANNTTQTYVGSGNIFHKKAGGYWAYPTTLPLANVDSDQEAAWRQAIDDARLAKDENHLIGRATYPTLANYDSDKTMLLVKYPKDDGLDWKQINFRHAMSNTSGWNNNNDYGILTAVKYGTTYDGGRYMKFNLDTDTTHPGVFPWDSHIFNAAEFASLSNSYDLLKGARDERIGKYSMVSLVTNNGNAVSTQAQEWADDLKNFHSWPKGSAAEYKGIDKDGQVVLYFHLHEDGHMFAPPTNSTVILNPVVKLEFNQWVDDGAIIPLVPATMQYYMKAQMDEAIVKFKSGLSLGNATAQLQR